VFNNSLISSEARQCNGVLTIKMMTIKTQYSAHLKQAY